MLEMDASTLGLLVIQLSANLLTQINDYPIEDDVKPTKGAGKLIHDRFAWASHGSANAVLKQAVLVYAVAGFLSEQPDHQIWLGMSDRNAAIRIITDALAKIQEWKEAVCKEIHQQHGEGFGAGTGFQKMNWVTHNEKLLAMITGSED